MCRDRAAAAARGQQAFYADVALFAALAEPNRLRIVELLNEHPGSAGEVAATLGLRDTPLASEVLDVAGLEPGFLFGLAPVEAVAARTAH